MLLKKSGKSKIIYLLSIPHVGFNERIGFFQQFIHRIIILDVIRGNNGRRFHSFHQKFQYRIEDSWPS